MTHQTAPAPPEGAADVLPEYFLEDIPHQNEEALKMLQEWITELLAYQQPLSEDTLSEMAAVTTTGMRVIADLSDAEKRKLDFSEMLGTFTWQFTQCDRDNCSCTSDQIADLHGPYLQRHYCDESGHYMSEYIPSNDSRQELVQRVIPKPMV